jgi:hypothetical protein
MEDYLLQLKPDKSLIHGHNSFLNLWRYIPPHLEPDSSILKKLVVSLCSRNSCWQTLSYLGQLRVVAPQRVQRIWDIVSQVKLIIYQQSQQYSQFPIL